MRNIEDMQAHAPEWRAKLEKELATHGSSDVVVPYGVVAFAFPSPEPNPRSFEVPLIDSVPLRQWAAGLGWNVQLAPEKKTNDPQGHPPVRFTRREQTHGI